MTTAPAKLLPSQWRWHPADMILLLQVVGLGLVLGAAWQGGPQHHPDTASYLDYLAHGWPDILTLPRTPAYPLWLWLHQTLTGTLAWVPLWQLGLHVAAVVWVRRGLGVFGFSPWSALLVASALLHANLLRYFGSALLTDAPSLSLGLAAAGSLLHATARPRQRGHWVLLALLLALAVLTRPAQLFMVPLVLILGTALLALHHERLRFPWSSLLPLLLAALLPLLAWSALRGVVVGHFGLVSFGGANIIGITAALLDDDVVQRLPAHLRPLALAITEERTRRGLASPFSDLGWIRYGPWVDQYNPNVHDIAWPAARRLTGGDMVASNNLMGELSLAIIRTRPVQYLRWLMTASVDGVLTLVQRDPVLQLSAMAMLAALAAGAWRGARPDRRWCVPTRERWAQARLEVGVLLPLALLHFAGGTALVVLVEPPLERYLFATSVWIPGLLLLLARHGALLLAVTPGEETTATCVAASAPNAAPHC
ncbi:MAG: hypothetical protein H7831_16780 [Magnetococcus sp. WYHC-3]